MNTIKLIAICALLAGGNASFGHENMPHHNRNAPVVKEQKPWGIAGDTQAVARTITGTQWNGYRFFGLRERKREDV